jgi:alpha-glucosidase
MGDAAARNVAGQRADPGSVLTLCRDLVALRRAELSGGVAAYQEITATGDLWAYRSGGLLVLANFSAAGFTWPGDAGEILLSTGEVSYSGDGALTIAPWQGIITRPPD